LEPSPRWQFVVEVLTVCGRCCQRAEVNGWCAKAKAAVCLCAQRREDAWRVLASFDGWRGGEAWTVGQGATGRGRVGARGRREVTGRGWR